MGAIALCLLVGVLVKSTWDFSTNNRERAKMIADNRENPLSHAVLFIWLVSIVVFWIGIFIPAFGRLEIAETGWHVVEVGAIGFFGIWFLGWFIDIEKLDKK